jgi:hypothetical protein
MWHDVNHGYITSLHSEMVSASLNLLAVLTITAHEKCYLEKFQFLSQLRGKLNMDWVSYKVIIEPSYSY